MYGAEMATDRLKANRILFSDNDYFKFLHAVEHVHSARTKDKEVEVIFTDKASLNNIIVPPIVKELATVTGVNTGSVITSILRQFELEYKHGQTNITKSLLKLIHEYNGINEEEKVKLLSHLLMNLNIQE